ncbi:hypothetical protein AX16_008956 [Volvariella volvacea WC 439]|nr:hypothetical protein AX16_008956 [Volvariella volvacea WC 439]
MALRLSPFKQPPQITSSIVKNVPDNIPSTDELERLHDELKLIKQKTMERLKKAGEDLKALEDSMRRLREKEKAKSKVLEKVKRERDYTPSLDSEDAKPPIPHSRPGSHPINGVPPSSSRSSLDHRKSIIDDKKKKKKRKRDDESEPEVETQRPRKATSPAPTPQPQPPPPPPPKAQKSTISSSSKPSTGPDFTLPPSYALLPDRPPLPPAPTPIPSKATDVTEDFSKQRPPNNQTPITTFYNTVEPWIRNIREEDIGFLEYTADEVEPFILPKLGRHYLDVWEEQDAAMFGNGGGIAADWQEAHESYYQAPVPKWDPSTLAETDLVNEEKGHAPLTERVISALLPMQDAGWKTVKAAEDAMEGRPGGSGAAAARREKMNVSDLENRIRDTMRIHGLLDGVPDFTNKVDDPIATALREAQAKLRIILATNKARKRRLAEIARDRLGYQEYLELRDSIDKNISTTYMKLQKKDAPKLARKKKKGGSSGSGSTGGEEEKGHGHAVNGVNGIVNGSASTSSNSTNVNGDVPPSTAGTPLLHHLPPTPAALGLSPDESNYLHIPEPLKHLADTRRQWVDTVGTVFASKQEQHPGRIWGLPSHTIYEGIEEEIEETLKGLKGEPEGIKYGVGVGSTLAVGSVVEGGSELYSTAGGGDKTISSANAAAMNLVKGFASGVNGSGGAWKGKGKERDDSMDVG